MPRSPRPLRPTPPRVEDIFIPVFIDGLNTEHSMRSGSGRAIIALYKFNTAKPELTTKTKPADYMQLENSRDFAHAVIDACAAEDETMGRVLCQAKDYSFSWLTAENPTIAVYNIPDTKSTRPTYDQAVAWMMKLPKVKT